MSNDHIKSEIPAYLAGSLAESRNRQIEAHAAACEKCRGALTKARAKQARVKREALKKASSDPLPNLFLARQGKETGVDRPASNGPWIIFGFLLAAGLGYWSLRHTSFLTHSSAPIPETPAIEASSATESSPLAPSAAAPALSTPTVAAAQPEPPKPPTVLPVQQEWKGPESGIKEARLVVIRNKDAWEKLWMDMQEADALPAINFDEHVVLGIFTGSNPAGSSISLGKIKEMEDEVYAPFRVTPSPDVQLSTAAAPAPSHPYLLALVPHTDKKIRLTQKEASR